MRDVRQQLVMKAIEVRAYQQRCMELSRLLMFFISRVNGTTVERGSPTVNASDADSTQFVLPRNYAEAWEIYQQERKTRKVRTANLPSHEAKTSDSTSRKVRKPRC